MTKLEYVSASQLKNFNRCPRVWFFDKVLRISYPPSQPLWMGSRIHLDLEEYLGGTKPYPATTEGIYMVEKGYLPSGEDLIRFRAMLGESAWLEYPTAHLEIEVNDVPIVGFIDVLACVNGIVYVYDYKTRSSLRYAPDEAELAYDLQLLLYAYCAAHKWPEAKTFVVGQINIVREDRGGPKVDCRQAIVNRDHVFRFIETKVADDIEKLKALPKIPNIQYVFGDSTACYDYGPCDHMDYCKKIQARPYIAMDNSLELDLDRIAPLPK